MSQYRFIFFVTVILIGLELIVNHLQAPWSELLANALSAYTVIEVLGARNGWNNDKTRYFKKKEQTDRGGVVRHKKRGEGSSNKPRRPRKKNNKASR